MTSDVQYTDFRLAHANAQHLHATSTTKFIGPIPHGWYATHKKSWLRPRTNYHRQSQAAHETQLSWEEARNFATCPRWLAEASLTKSNSLTQGTAISDNTFSTNHGARNSSPTSGADRADSSAYRSADQTAVTPESEAIFNASHDSIAIPHTESGGANQHDSDRVDVGPMSNEYPVNVKTVQSRAISFKDDANVDQADRPMMNITSPKSGAATRESSTVSSASFATAPESLEEQARLIRDSTVHDDDDGDMNDEEISDHDSQGEQDEEDDVSESSTIRYTPKLITTTAADNSVMNKARSTVEESRTRSYSPLGHLEVTNPASNRTTSSSDANSRKSLIRHGNQETSTATANQHRPISHLVRFNTEPLNGTTSTGQVQRGGVSAEGSEIHERVASLQNRRSAGYFNQSLLRNPFRKVEEVGELLRAERMLLRVECARSGGVPEEYNETKANRVERTTDMHWREFVLAARENEEGLIVLSFHRNRTIPIIAKSRTKIKASAQIVLDPRTTKVNLYSSLDKTIVIWQQASKKRKGTMIYVLRPCTTHASIEWYAFIKTRMNMKPNSVATIQVPSLNMTLRLNLTPDFSNTTKSSSDSVLSNSSKSSDSDSHYGTMEINSDGQMVAGGVAITGEYLINTCWDMLLGSNEWRDVLHSWQQNEKMGLCWRRYDRIEWIHGHNARQLIGQWAMQASHELEFRPKEHYPTQVKLPSGEVLEEPSPIEGFLVRLTGSTGRQARFGKVFYKKLYFSSHDNLLFFSTPAKATPPPPAGFSDGRHDNIETLLADAPLVYDVEPYPLTEGHISWLRGQTSPEAIISHDAIAFTESARRVAQLQASEGFIKLAQVIHIRKYKVTREDKENNINHRGSNIRFHDAGNEEDDVLEFEDGITNEFDDARVFELVLDTGLVIRLQSFDSTTRQAWMEHLAKLVRYWKWRHKADSVIYHKLRRANLDALQIDEELEGLVGQYASKWEVSQCVSEPQIYNFCPISSCRSIALRGLLYRKPRVHSTFRQYECVISHGQMLIYHHSVVDATGIEIPRIHHTRKEVLELTDCYIYSGNITSTDLLATREASGRDGAGRHTLPRLFEDGWTSQDEQEALCFVVWTGRRRTALSVADKKDRNRTTNSVSRLGTPGKSMIYMARCRQERDLWVQILATEIERNTSAGLE